MLSIAKPSAKQQFFQHWGQRHRKWKYTWPGKVPLLFLSTKTQHQQLAISATKASVKDWNYWACVHLNTQNPHFKFRGEYKALLYFACIKYSWMNLKYATEGIGFAPLIISNKAEALTQLLGSASKFQYCCSLLALDLRLSLALA